MSDPVKLNKCPAAEVKAASIPPIPLIEKSCACQSTNSGTEEVSTAYLSNTFLYSFAIVAELQGNQTTAESNVSK
ncbi:hypothetical protein D9M71_821650 [compost metagenome]